ncbi:hypothetical protein OQA88_9560 [Cercophora sp. LCS_1]
MEPCASCLKSKIVNCTYEEARRPKPRLWRLSPTADPDSPTSDNAFPRLPPGGAAFTFRPEGHSVPSAAGTQYATSAASLSSARPTETVASSPSTHPTDLTGSTHQPLNNTTALEDRVRQLEQQLADALKRQEPPKPLHILPSQREQAQAVPSQSALPSASYAQEDQWATRPKFFPLVTGLAERLETDRRSNAWYLLQKCKRMSKGIKGQILSALNRPVQIGSPQLPEPVVRELAESYFRTFESAYRILHRPTFWTLYRQYWENHATVSEGFEIQLKLCMAIGTCFHEDFATHRHTLATRWIYDARIWLASPDEKMRMSIEGLQVMCLLHLAREVCGVGSDLGWLSAGCLLRTAMHLGLHRDPNHFTKISILQAELRRRLWATILEITLQSSLDSGGPPMVALADYDTRSPSNYDDEQLSDSAEQSAPGPRALNSFTQSTVQLALLRSFPTRLGIAEYVNQSDLGASYEQTLRWNTELTNACRALSATLQPSYDPAGILPKRLSLFQLRLAEQMVHRFFLALNHPWLTQNNPAYYFARKMCVETSLKLYKAIAGSMAESKIGGRADDFSKLATCGHGAFRSIPTLAMLSLCLELLWQVQEDQTFRQTMDIDHHSGAPGDNDMAPGGIGSGAAPRQELIDAVRCSVSWTNRRIMAGETNLKGRLFYSAFLTQVQALQRGALDAEVERLVMANMDADLEHCWHLLKELEASTPGSPTDTDSNDIDDWEGDDPSRCHGFRSIFNFNDVETFLRG